MTRKDYEIIAKKLSLARFGKDMACSSLEQVTGFAIAVQAVADALEVDNRRFNPKLFVERVSTYTES